MSESIDINTIIQMAVFFCQGYLLQFFLGSFPESSLKPLSERSMEGLFKRIFYVSEGRKFFVIVIYGLFIFVINRVLPSEYGSVRILGKLILTFVTVLGITMFFYKAKSSLKIFLSVTFLAVCECSFFIAYMIMVMGQYLTDFWVILLDRGFFASTDIFLDTVEISLTVVMFLMYGVFLLLSGFFLRKITKYYREKDYSIQREELLFILTPGLVGLLLCTLLRLIMITAEGDVPRLLYDRHPLLMWLVPAILFLSLMSVLYSIKLFQDMIDLNRERSGRIILEKQIKSMQEHVKEVEHIYADVRSMKHDMKNTLSVVMQLAGKGGKAESAELQAYLVELNQHFDRLQVRFQTGNVVVDTLLAMKYNEALRLMPDIQIDAEKLLLSDNLNIQSYDIGVVLGNALDNALEACLKLKHEQPQAPIFIRLSSNVRGKMLFVEVENSFNGKLIRSRQSEFPITDKGDKKAHGIGLMNIKSTAEKYHGGVDWSVNGRVFTLFVMMQNERRAENEY